MKRFGIVIVCGLWLAASARAAQITFTDPVQVVPGPTLPPEVHCLMSNNNLDLVRFDGRLFFAFRTGTTHFANKKVHHYILSSADEGKTWDYEAQVFLGSDMREPRLLVLGGKKLMFYFFQAGKNPLSFTPVSIYAMERKGPRDWTEPVKVFSPGCVLWRAKEHEGKPYITAYCGEGEYTGGNSTLQIYFLTTADGFNFTPIDPNRPVVATGGSETDFDFDDAGNLYSVIRNEAGDGKTWGSKVCRAPAADLANWTCNVTPFKFDSPLMFRHGQDFYLIARRNVDNEYDKNDRWLPNSTESLYYLARYWWTPKRTAVYQLDPGKLEFTPILDFPFRGDTAFPGLVPIDADHYLMYNYSSDPSGKDRVWMSGQLHQTNIYSTVITIK